MRKTLLDTGAPVGHIKNSGRNPTGKVLRSLVAPTPPHYSLGAVQSLVSVAGSTRSRDVTPAPRLPAGEAGNQKEIARHHPVAHITHVGSVTTDTGKKWSKQAVGAWQAVGGDALGHRTSSMTAAGTTKCRLAILMGGYNDTESAFAKTPWTCETTKPFSHDER